MSVLLEKPVCRRIRVSKYKIPICGNTAMFSEDANKSATRGLLHNGHFLRRQKTALLKEISPVEKFFERNFKYQWKNKFDCCRKKHSSISKFVLAE